MKEIWKKIIDVDGEYFVSSLGSVKSYMGYAGKPEIIIKPTLDARGYERVCLGKRINRKTYKVHRLVAIAFMPNPENKRTVNHKSGIKNDNRLINLEWATDSENAKHAVNILGRVMPKNHTNHKSGSSHFKSRPVFKVDKRTGSIIARYESGNIAAKENGLEQANIHGCISGKRKSTGGYKWKYA